MILGFCGNSNSGKTFMIEQIIKKFGKKYKINVVKHTLHGIDVSGKDSTIFRSAGAREVVLIGDEVVRFQSFQPVFSVIKSLSGEITLVEGFKTEKFIPKICLGTAKCVGCVLTDPTLEEVIKYISKNIEIEKIEKKLPNFNCGECGHSNCKEMAMAIYEGKDTFEHCRYWNPVASISVKVNGKDIYMGKFAQDIVIKTISGLLSSFKGVKDISDVKIKFRTKTQ